MLCVSCIGRTAKFFDGEVAEFVQRVWPINQDVLCGELCTLTRDVFYKLQVERVPYD